jgi:competence protein ComGC
MVDEFRAARGFVLELMVVIILVIEIVFLFRGK